MKSLRKAQQSSKKRPRFWLGPLLAGSCFAFGYGIANRLLSLGSEETSLQNKRFERQAFPGIELNELRNLHGGTRVELLLLDAPKKMPSELVVVDSTNYEAEQASTNGPANIANPLPLIFWTPKFPSQRPFSLPEELPKAP